MAKHSKKTRNPRLDPRRGTSPLENLPAHPVEVLGIDIGRAGIHICTPQIDYPPEKWAVYYLDYKKNLDWHDLLVKLCDGRTHVFAEPTGWHYLSPVASVIVQHTAAKMHLVTHSVTGGVRENFVAKQKTDTTDARAIALIGYNIVVEKKSVKGVWTYDHDLEQHVINLRLLVNTHYKLTAELAKNKNRLKHFGQSMSPILSMSETWYTCISLGAVTPLQILELEKPDNIDGYTWRWVKVLKDKLYPIEVPDTIVNNAIRVYEQQLFVQEALPEVQNEIEQVVIKPPFDEITRRWMTVPGANLVRCAALHVATHGMADQYTLEQVKASVGAYPQIEQSGAFETTRSSKKGYRPAMRAIEFWAMWLTKADAPNNEIRDYFKGGVKNGGRKWTAAKAKLVRILSAVARSPEGYRSPR